MSAPPVTMTLWKRAPAWRASLVLAATLSALAVGSAVLSSGVSPALPEQVSYTPPPLQAPPGVHLPPAGFAPGPRFLPPPGLVPEANAHLSLGATPAVVGPSGIDTALLGRTWTGSLPVDGFEVPLPPGEWAMLTNADVHSPNSAGKGYVFGRIEHRRLIGVVRVLAMRSTTQPAQGFRAGECISPNANLNYVAVKAAQVLDHQGCWSITHAFTPPMLQWADQAVPLLFLERKAAGDLAAKGVTYPQDFVVAHFVRAEKWGMLDVQYWFNPETENITSGRALSLPESDWHPGNLQRFADKQAYVERLKQWAGVFWERFDRAFSAS